MTLRLYSIILFVILMTSGLSSSLLFFYMNPENSPRLAFGLMGISSFLLASSLLSFLLFFLKKLYLRGDINISTMHHSLRQSILISL